MLKAIRLVSRGTALSRLRLPQTQHRPSLIPYRVLGIIATVRLLSAEARFAIGLSMKNSHADSGEMEADLYFIGENDSVTSHIIQEGLGYGRRNGKGVATLPSEFDIPKVFSASNGSAKVDIGDPLGCDSAEMRIAKARCKYSWFTCETEREKYILQVQDRAYFFVQRDSESTDQRYNCGYALALPGAKIDHAFSCSLDQITFRFQPKVIVFNALTLAEAFKNIEVLVSLMVDDGRVKRILEREADWRQKPRDFNQLKMLLRMQWVYNVKCADDFPEIRMDCFKDALSMTRGQLSDLLNALLHSHFDPADDQLYKGHFFARGKGDDCPVELELIARSYNVRQTKEVNNFWEGR